MSQNMLSMMMQGSPSAPTYSDDVFSAYTYSGNSGAQTLTNTVNLSTNGGLVWIKQRSGATSDHVLYDSARGFTKYLSTDVGSGTGTTSAQMTSFNTTGCTLAYDGSDSVNKTGITYVAWMFRKAAKFFDIVTYTGNGANRTVAHSLGQAPGMILIKRTSSGGSAWRVYHRSLANTEYLVIDTTAAKATGTTAWNSTTADASVFSLGTDVELNENTATYVAYLFAHDTATDGLIQCGTFTTDGSGAGSVTLGWEPQYVLYKNTDGAASDWQVMDSSRAMPVTSGLTARLYPNGSYAEGVGNGVMPNATGFTTLTITSRTMIYLAIRRPNKPPTLGTQVYNAIARTGTGAAATVTGVGFAPDLVMSSDRGANGYQRPAFDRLRGAPNALVTSAANAESGTSTDTLTAFAMDGFTAGASSVNQHFVNFSGYTYINWFFKRAPGVFDEVCYTGTGAAATFSHSLGVAPELLISKNRSGTGTRWYVYHATLGATKFLGLNETSTPTTATAAWNDTAPTSSIFTVGSGDTGTTDTHVAYLFATKAGISKVGSYTGDGTTGQTINCGFTTGARFVLIKRTDSTGDWFVWDSTRGIVAGNDPHLSLNTTAAEVTTDDTIDADTSGFIVNQVAATNVNVTSATYIYLTFA